MAQISQCCTVHALLPFRSCSTVTKENDGEDKRTRTVSPLFLFVTTNHEQHQHAQMDLDQNTQSPPPSYSHHTPILHQQEPPTFGLIHDATGITPRIRHSHWFGCRAELLWWSVMYVITSWGICTCVAWGFCNCTDRSYGDMGTFEECRVEVMQYWGD
ncbi:hypothetical protein BDR03DRAFT_948763 [Suillus americanus]|nr:hypothetical protein BDR03DRAFT_948763 [Suillus americanus]